jgi:hypothetical protein
LQSLFLGWVGLLFSFNTQLLLVGMRWRVAMMRMSFVVFFAWLGAGLGIHKRPYFSKNVPVRHCSIVFSQALTFPLKDARTGTICNYVKQLPRAGVISITATIDDCLETTYVVFMLMRRPNI